MTLTLEIGWSCSKVVLAVLFCVPLVDWAAKAPWSAGDGVQSAGKMVRSAGEGVRSAGKAVQSAERRRRRVRMKEAVLRAHSNTRDPFTEIKCGKGTVWKHDYLRQLNPPVWLYKQLMSYNFLQIPCCDPTRRPAWLAGREWPSDFVRDGRSMPPALTDHSTGPGSKCAQNTLMTYVTQGRHGLVI